MEQTIEQKVSQAILQKEIASIEIDGETYKIAPPSIATLILISEIISTLPIVEKPKNDDAGEIAASALHYAKDFRKLGDIAAVLILGARNLTKVVETTETKPILFGLVKLRRTKQIEIDAKARLARLILENVRPSVLWEIIVKRLNMHEIGDFFAITTSLSEANLIKPTREVGE